MYKYKLKEELVVRCIYDKLFLIDPKSQKYNEGDSVYSVNESGRIFVEMMQTMDHFSSQDLLEKAMDYFELTPDMEFEIRHDIDNFIEDLLNKGYVLPSQQIESKDISFNQKSESSLTKKKRETYDWKQWTEECSKRMLPLNGGIEVTRKCNMNCVHCYLEGAREEELLSFHELKSILDTLEASNILSIYFTGGEVFSRKDFMDLYLYAKRKGFLVSILTNGTLIRDEDLKVLSAYPPHNLSISLYGMTEEVYNHVTQSKGNFNTIISNIKKICKLGLNLELKFIMLNENKHEYSLAKEFAESLGIELVVGKELFPTFCGDTAVYDHLISLEEAINVERDNSKLSKAYQLVSDTENPFLGRDEKPLFLCGIGSNSFLIDSEGWLNPCSKSRIKRFNLLRDDFSSSWKKFSSYKKVQAHASYKCLTCPDINYCSPCPMVNYLSTGDYEKPDERKCQLAAMRRAAFSDININMKEKGGDDNEKN